MCTSGKAGKAGSVCLGLRLHRNAENQCHRSIQKRTHRKFRVSSSQDSIKAKEGKIWEPGTTPAIRPKRSASGVRPRRDKRPSRTLKQRDVNFISRICYLELLGCPAILSQLKGMLKWHHKNLDCRIQATPKNQCNVMCRGCTICTMYLSQPRCRLRKWRATTMAPAAATDLRTQGTWILTIISLKNGKAGLWGSKGNSDVMNLNRTPFPGCMFAWLHSWPFPHLYTYTQASLTTSMVCLLVFIQTFRTWSIASEGCFFPEISAQT